jgi:hypothetical protein
VVEKEIYDFIILAYHLIFSIATCLVSSAANSHKMWFVVKPFELCQNKNGSSFAELVAVSEFHV